MRLAIQNLRQAGQTARKKLSRRILHWRMRGKSEDEILAAERRLRGVEQFDKLQKADVVVVSFGKSGRTWLRVMVSHLFRVMYGLPDNAIIGFDNFHNLNRSVPKIFFTHDNYIKDFTGDFETKQPFYDKPVILLARDPPTRRRWDSSRSPAPRGRSGHRAEPVRPLVARGSPGRQPRPPARGS